MKILSFEEFNGYYEKFKKLPNNIYVNKDKKLNSSQLITKYNKYLQSIEKQKIRQENLKIKQFEKNQKIINDGFVDLIDEKWIAVKEVVWLRDKGECQFYKSLNKTNRIIADNIIEEYKFLSMFDPCHIISRSRSTYLKYEPLNIITMRRVFHSRIDSYIHPLYNCMITEEQRNEIWISIVGLRRWNFLKEKENAIH